MKKIYIILGAFFLLGNNLIAQNHWCATDEKFAEMAKQNPALLQQRLDNDAKTRQWIDSHPRTTNQNKGTGTPNYIIPVVFHIMNDVSGGDIVTNANIQESIDVLNRDFRRNNADTNNTRDLFKPYASDFEIEFRLATKDPNGNCTNGILRHNSELTNNATDAVKGVTDAYWDANKYYNIWVVKSIDGSIGSGTILGYAQFPGSGALSTFGVVIIASEIQSINNRTLTHEVGHCLNLYHTHQGGCAGDCKTTGDQCCDTPQESEASYILQCNSSLNDCTDANAGVDFVFTGNPPNPTENYMSYAGCQNMFTLDQKDRAYAAIANNSFLSNLTSANNLTATGTAPGTVASICADFKVANNQSISCAETQVSFEDLTHGNTPDAWEWSFGDGGTATTKNPSYTYSEPGVYTVTLKAKNTDDNDSSTTAKENIITINPIKGGLISPLYENFEDNDFPKLVDPIKEWTVINATNVKWERTIAAGYTGAASLGLPLKSIPSERKYELISPTIDFTESNCNKLTYKYAYAKRYTSSNESLSISVSRDCGKTWQVVFQAPNSGLVTIDSLIAGTFIPSENDWKEEEVSLASFAGRKNILIKFTITTGNGNHFYIDDIDVGCNTNTGVKETFNIDFKVYPNPFENDANLNFSLKKSSEISINIVDILGKILYSKNSFYTEGNHETKINNLVSLEKGIYFINISD